MLHSICVLPGALARTAEYTLVTMSKRQVALVIVMLTCNKHDCSNECCEQALVVKVNLSPETA